MNLIYIYDRGNPNDQIASGQLRFDDGSVVACGPANNDGSSFIYLWQTSLTESMDDQAVPHLLDFRHYYHPLSCSRLHPSLKRLQMLG